MSKMEALKRIKTIILDVDGVLTDSGIYYDNSGNEIKKFSTRDYAGIQAAHYLACKVIILTGRSSIATERRAQELGVDELYQGVKDKYSFINEYIEEHDVCAEEYAYIGDDLNDYKPMMLVGFKACPADACIEIKSIADYVSGVKGGSGVVQDVFRYVLRELGEWDRFVLKTVESGS